MRATPRAALRRLERPVHVLEGEVEVERRGERVRLDHRHRALGEEVRRVRAVGGEARRSVVGQVVGALLLLLPFSGAARSGAMALLELLPALLFDSPESGLQFHDLASTK